MIPSSSAVSSRLTWSQIPRTRTYELKANDAIAGTMLHPANRSSNFVAETQDGRWSFRRAGLLGVGAEILDSDSQQKIATFISGWGGEGLLTFTDGERFRLECKGWLHPVWTVLTEAGKPVLHVRSREKTVELMDTPISRSRVSLLSVFAWYRVLQAEEDADSAATVAMIA